MEKQKFNKRLNNIVPKTVIKEFVGTLPMNRRDEQYTEHWSKSGDDHCLKGQLWSSILEIPWNVYLFFLRNFGSNHLNEDNNLKDDTKRRS